MSKLKELVSPFEEWPGSLFIPERIDAAAFNQWWEAFNRIEDAIETGDDERHSALTAWESRFHLIRKSTLKLGNDLEKRPYEIEPTGLRLPSIRIARWFYDQTEPLLDEEMSLKNSPGPSTPTKSTTSS